MEIFDTFYRPDTPSQRYRLIAVTIPALVAGVMPWVKPLYRWAASKPVTRMAADLWATILKLFGTAGPFPSPQAFVQGLLIIGAVLALLQSVSLQIGVLRGFAPGSRMLRMAQWLLGIIGIELLMLVFAWPSK